VNSLQAAMVIHGTLTGRIMRSYEWEKLKKSFL